MSIIQGNAKQASTRGFYNFPIEQSLRFNDDDSAYLTWTPDETGDSQKKFTLSFWVKRANIEESQIFSIGSSTSNRMFLRFDSSHFLDFFCNSGGSTIGRYTTSRVFRDPSSWYHIVVSVDTSLANANSIRIYINGEEDSGSPSTNFNNQSTVFGTQIIHAIGSESWSLGSTILDGYLAEFHCVDNAQLGPDSFGELKNGVWIPKDPSGLTYGTNGFRLSFADDAEVEAFNTVLWKGDGSTSSSKTGVGFKPDLVWIKSRSGAQWHHLFDAVRGGDKRLHSNSTNAESTLANSQVLSFDSDGFTVTEGENVNSSANNYVAWCWKAGDSNVSNNVGSIPSTVRANDTYGFSIVSYTGNATASATVGHGLSSAPDFLVVKNRDDGSANWNVWHKDLTTDYSLYLNLGNAENPNAPLFFGDGTNMVVPTSSVFTIGSNSQTNGNTQDIIAYCWAEKSGYSKFGINTTSRVSCGFKPALVILKDTATSGSWYLLDNTRDADGDFNHQLYGQLPNSEDAPSTSTLTIDDGTAYGNDGGGFTVTWTAQTDRYGTGVIYAAFADTREAAFWLDQSDNDNDWQPVNLDHNDTVADSPTNNFCTWNPLQQSSNLVLSDGNLVVNNSTTEANHRLCVATHGMTSGKYYWEIYVNNSANVDMVGIVGQNANMATHIGGSGFAIGYNTSSGNYYQASGWSNDGTAPPTGFPASGTIGVAFDADAKKIYFHLNGNYLNSADPVAGTGANGSYSGSETTFFPAISIYNNTGKWTANFGQQPFKYDPPA